MIGAFVTKHMIQEGEELFTNYGPGYAHIVGKPDNPKKIWYYDLWKKFKEQHSDQIKFIEYFEKVNKETLLKKNVRFVESSQLNFPKKLFWVLPDVFIIMFRL